MSPSNISAPLARPSTGNADKKMQGIQNGLDFFGVVTTGWVLDQEKHPGNGDLICITQLLGCWRHFGRKFGDQWLITYSYTRGLYFGEIYVSYNHHFVHFSYHSSGWTFHDKTLLGVAPFIVYKAELTLPETNSLHMRNGCCEGFGARPIFRCRISLRCNFSRGFKIWQVVVDKCEKNQRS